MRSRFYDPASGRFPTKDSWQGDYNRPLSLNKWMYVEGNPINYIDPTGYIAETEALDANLIVKELKVYDVRIRVDWGYIPVPQFSQLPLSVQALYPSGCYWRTGDWELQELVEIRKGVVDLARAMGGLNKFIFNLGYIDVYKNTDSVLARGGVHFITVNRARHDISRWATVHELGHVWDANFGDRLSKGLVTITNQYGKNWGSQATCDSLNKLPGCNTAGYVYADIPAAGSDINFTPREDFASSVAAYVYPVDTQTYKVQQYNTLNQGFYQKYLYYTDFRTTIRWRYIDALVLSTNKGRLP